MPISFEIDRARDLTIFTAVGDVPFGELAEHSTGRIGKKPMPMKYDLRYSSDLAIFTLTGKLTLKDTMEVLDAYFKSGILGFEIVDASGGSLRNLKSTQMDRVIDWVAANAVTRPAVSKSAFVVPPDADRETAQFFHLLTTSNRACWEPKMVRSLLEAYHWLDIPPEGS